MITITTSISTNVKAPERSRNSGKVKARRRAQSAAVGVRHGCEVVVGADTGERNQACGLYSASTSLESVNSENG